MLKKHKALTGLNWRFGAQNKVFQKSEYHYHRVLNQGSRDKNYFLKH